MSDVESMVGLIAHAMTRPDRVLPTDCPAWHTDGPPCPKFVHESCVSAYDKLAVVKMALEKGWDQEAIRVILGAINAARGLLAELATPPPAAKSDDEYPTPWRRESGGDRVSVIAADGSVMCTPNVCNVREENEKKADLIIAHANRTTPKCGCDELMPVVRNVNRWFMSRTDDQRATLGSGNVFTRLNIALAKHAGGWK